MGLLDLFKKGWRWDRPGPPPPGTVAAMLKAITSGSPDRLRVLEQAAALTRPGRSSAAAAAEALCEAGLLAAAAGVLQFADPLTEDDLTAVLHLAENLSELPDERPALDSSGLVPALLGLLTGEQPGSEGANGAGRSKGSAGGWRGQVGGGSKAAVAAACKPPELPPAAKEAILRCLRIMAQRGALLDAMRDEGRLGALVAVLKGAVREEAFGVAAQAAWALEMLAASRRLCTRIGELGGVAAVAALLRAALVARPAVKELPRSEEATRAASTAVHALAVLLADCRANRGRLRDTGAVPLLAEVLGDSQLEWEAKEQAAELLADLASTLLLDERPLAESAHFDEWRADTMPRLVKILQQVRGLPHMLPTKEAAVRVLERLAANGEECSAIARHAGALAPLGPLLSAGAQMAGGQRQLCCAVLRSLRELAPANLAALAQVSAPLASGRQVQLLHLLGTLLEEGAEADPQALAQGWAQDLVVQAGWLAASVVARLCLGNHSNQDEVVSHGMLRPLCAYLQAPLELLGVAGAAGEESRDAVLRIKCEVAEALRSISLRAAHHAALRAAGVPQRAQQVLASTVPVWTELRSSAKKILQNLGELPDLDRPLLAYSPEQLAHLLTAQGIEAGRLRERGVGGAQLVRLGDGELREAVPAAQVPRVLRVLRAFETFDEVDSAGTRDGCLTLGKLAAYLGQRGFRQEEIVPLAESLVQLMDGDRDDLISFPDFLQCYDEFRQRVMLDVQPPSKRRRISVAAS